MITQTRKLRQYCCDDIATIENYDNAINDDIQIWHCHHKAEILPCGKYSVEELKKFNLYWHQPADRLIFMTEHDHQSLHHSGSNSPMFNKPSPMKGKYHSEKTKMKMSLSHNGRVYSPCQEQTKLKISLANKGKHHSEKTKMKMSLSNKGRFRGTHWYNNGEVNVRRKDCPKGFKEGYIDFKKGINI